MDSALRQFFVSTWPRYAGGKGLECTSGRCIRCFAQQCRTATESAPADSRIRRSGCFAMPRLLARSLLFTAIQPFGHKLTALERSCTVDAARCRDIEIQLKHLLPRNHFGVFREWCTHVSMVMALILEPRRAVGKYLRLRCNEASCVSIPVAGENRTLSNDHIGIPQSPISVYVALKMLQALPV